MAQSLDPRMVPTKAPRTVLTMVIQKALRMARRRGGVKATTTAHTKAAMSELRTAPVKDRKLVLRRDTD